MAGTEDMVIPVNVQPGGTGPLTVVDSSDYYVWQGSSTSAQYYVQKAGVDPSRGCTWGTAAELIGNFAPLVSGFSLGNHALLPCQLTSLRCRSSALDSVMESPGSLCSPTLRPMEPI